MGFAYNEGDLYLSILMACVMGAVTIYTAREFDIPMTSAVVISACCGGLVFFGCGRFGKLGKKTRDFVSFDITVEGFGLFILTLFILSVIAFLITRVMRNQRVTREEIGLTARLLRQSDDFIRNCSEIGSTLREFDRPLVRKGAFSKQTDYQRARQRVLRNGRVILRRVRRIQNSRLSSALTRASVVTERNIESCMRCPLVNLKRKAEGKAFLCLVRRARTRARFELGENGEILEHE